MLINCLEVQIKMNGCKLWFFKTIVSTTGVYNYRSEQNADYIPGTKYNDIYKYTNVHSSICMWLYTS